jgi:hypothetical protein
MQYEMFCIFVCKSNIYIWSVQHMIAAVHTALDSSCTQLQFHIIGLNFMYVFAKLVCYWYVDVLVELLPYTSRTIFDVIVLVL